MDDISKKVFQVLVYEYATATHLTLHMAFELETTKLHVEREIGQFDPKLAGLILELDQKAREIRQYCSDKLDRQKA